jgi:hypothetical protein
MVREAQKRRRKFEAKMHPESVKQRFQELKPQMVRAHDEDFAIYTQLEDKIRQVCLEAGVMARDLIYYIIFGKRLCKMRYRYTEETLKLEASTEYQKWLHRGLDAGILARVAELVGVVIIPPPPVYVPPIPPPPPPPPPPTVGKVFVLDEGILDVDYLG